MSHEEAESWCRKYNFQFQPYCYQDGTERSGWAVAGWAWSHDRNKPEVRVFYLSEKLPDAVEMAKKKYETVSRS